MKDAMEDGLHGLLTILMEALVLLLKIIIPTLPEMELAERLQFLTLFQSLVAQFLSKLEMKKHLKKLSLLKDQLLLLSK